MPAVALLKLAEVARLLRRSPRTIQRYRERGIFPEPIRIAGWPMWRAADIEAFLARRASGSESDRAAAGR